MAKLTYLQLVNRCLRRLSQSDATDVTSLSGQSQIVADAINEAQTELWKEENWYSLYKTTTFATVASTGTYDIATIASDWGRVLDMIDTTNNRVLIEDITRVFDEDDPDADYTGTPTHFTVEGANFRLYPIPNGAYTIRLRYYQIPDTLSANSDTYDLPYECENCLIQFALATTYEYLNKFDNADRAWIKYGQHLKKAKAINGKMIDRFRVIGRKHWIDGIHGIRPPKLPSNYPGYY